MRWGISMALHVIAATVVAASFGGALAAGGGALGAPWGAGWSMVVVGAGGAAFLRAAGLVRFTVPQLRRQVPDWWRTYFGPHAAAALYGGALGVGFLTFVRHATLLVVAVAAAASGEPLLGAAIMAPFGLARAAAAGLAGFGRQAAMVDRLGAFAAGTRILPVANGLAAAAVTLTVVPSLRAVAPEDVAGLAAAAVALAFGWGAGWKAIRFEAWRQIVASHALGRLRAMAVVGVPLLEIAVAVAVPGGRVRPAAAGAVAFLTAASVVVVRARRSGRRRLRCGCFGAAEIDAGRALLRNAVLAAAAVTAAIGSEPDASVIPEAQALPLVLAIGGIGGAALVAVLVRRAFAAAPPPARALDVPDGAA